MKRYGLASCILLFAALLFAAPSSEASLFNANADFVDPSPNPNGVWTYGYSSTLGGSLTPFLSSQFVSNAIGFGWDGGLGSGTPAYFKITSGPVNGVATGETALHGGPGGEYATLRFTAPSAGIYNVSALWKPGDTGDADLFLLLNSNVGSPLGSTSSTNTAGTFQVNNLSLNAGDRIDLALGIAGDTFFNDSTPVNLQISTASTGAVPEPAAFAVWGLGGALALGLAYYRRKPA